MEDMSENVVNIEYFLKEKSLGNFIIDRNAKERVIYETAFKNYITNYDSYIMGGLGDPIYRDSRTLDKYTKLALNRFYSDIGADVVLI